MTSTIQTTLSHLLTALIQSYLILLESNKLFCMCLFYSFFSQFVLCKRCLYTQACFDVARPASTHRLKGDGLKRVSMDILLYTFRYSEIRLTQAHTHTQQSQTQTQAQANLRTYLRTTMSAQTQIPNAFVHIFFPRARKTHTNKTGKRVKCAQKKVIGWREKTHTHNYHWRKSQSNNTILKIRLKTEHIKREKNKMK